MVSLVTACLVVAVKVIVSPASSSELPELKEKTNFSSSFSLSSTLKKTPAVNNPPNVFLFNPDLPFWFLIDVSRNSTKELLINLSSLLLEIL